jgi:hypothetical protein
VWQEQTEIRSALDTFSGYSVCSGTRDSREKAWSCARMLDSTAEEQAHKLTNQLI